MQGRVYIPVTGDHYGKIGSRGGLCEIVGDRLTQEDAVACDESAASASFATLKPQQQERAMEKIFADLQKKCGAASNTGSCACVATGQVKEGRAVVSTSYVGDSVSFLVVVHPNGTNEVKAEVKACNPELHDFNNMKEVKAIIGGDEIDKSGRKNGRIIRYRGATRLADPRIGVEGGLAITRAIGDVTFDKAGLSHVPQTTHATVEIKPDDLVFMVVGCDGMMEHCKGRNAIADYTKDLGQIFNSLFKEGTPVGEYSPEGIAQVIAHHAYAQKSGDNISVMVVPLEHDKPAVTAAVFDGHGGSEVAEALGKQFQSSFTSGINAFIQEDPEIRAELLQQAFTEYRTHLDSEIQKHPTDRDLAAKIIIMDRLKMEYKQGGTSLANLPAIKNLLAAPSEQDPTKTNLDILTKQRYAYHGLKHSIIAVAKMIFLALPALIADRVTSGKTGAYQKLFPVKGHDFVEKIKKAEGPPTLSTPKLG